jgi:hypothetical protein
MPNKERSSKPFAERVKDRLRDLADEITAVLEGALNPVPAPVPVRIRRR